MALALPRVSLFFRTFSEKHHRAVYSALAAGLYYEEVEKLDFNVAAQTTVGR
jgi:hypothetical protein